MDLDIYFVSWVGGKDASRQTLDFKWIARLRYIYNLTPGLDLALNWFKSLYAMFTEVLKKVHWCEHIFLHLWPGWGYGCKVKVHLKMHHWAWIIFKRIKILVEIYSSVGGMDASRWTVSSGINWKVKVHRKTHDRAGSNFSLCMLSLQRS